MPDSYLLSWRRQKYNLLQWSGIRVHLIPAMFIMTPQGNKVGHLICADGKGGTTSTLAPKSTPQCTFRNAGGNIDIAKRFNNWKHLDSSEADPSEWKDPEWGSTFLHYPIIKSLEEPPRYRKGKLHIKYNRTITVYVIVRSTWQLQHWSLGR